MFASFAAQLHSKMMSRANNPDLKSWIHAAPDSDFPIQNLPFGIFKTNDRSPRIGVAIGDYILDLKTIADAGLFNTVLKEISDVSVFSEKYLNSFIALGKPITNAIRERVSDLLNETNAELRNHSSLKENAIVKQTDATLLIPIQIPNYTDFYSSIEHATNVGIMFRDPANALLPNWRHLPVGYHGRASSIVVSGTPIHRPKGQTKTDEQALPTFQPTKSLDFELEMGFIIGKETAMGESVSTAKAEEYMFGMVVFNDWSARDVQRWEYVPLGPFLAKNFGSTVSPWVVTMEALEPFRVPSPIQEPAVLPYLQYEGMRNYNIDLEVQITPQNGSAHTVSRSNFRYMYWNMCQQLAHHTVNGCNIQVGDLYASGTISGHTPDSFGSMLELTWGGKTPLILPDGTERKFINDNDTITMRASCKNDRVHIGFGTCSGTILPATTA